MTEIVYNASIVCQRVRRLVAAHGSPNRFACNEVFEVDTSNARMWLGRALRKPAFVALVNALAEQSKETWRVKGYADGWVEVENARQPGCRLGCGAATTCAAHAEGVDLDDVRCGTCSKRGCVKHGPTPGDRLVGGGQ